MGRLGLELESEPHVVGRLGSGHGVGMGRGGLSPGVFSVGGLSPGGIVSRESPRIVIIGGGRGVVQYSVKLSTSFTAGRTHICR